MSNGFFSITRKPNGNFSSQLSLLLEGFKYCLSYKIIRLSLLVAGADLGFSRGGADFQKKFENFDDLFFRSTKLIFRALPKHCFAPILAGKFLKKKQSKKPFLGTF